MATLSIALVVGLAGIVNAATMVGNPISTTFQSSNPSASVNHNNLPSMGAGQGTTSQTDLTQPSQSGIPSTTLTKGYTRMNSNVTMNEQVQNMSMTTPMNEQMNHVQGMGGIQRSNQTNASSSTQGQNFSGKTMMGSNGRMGR